jgi:hypothetical protein
MSRFVRWGDSLLPRTLVEPDPQTGVCPQCGGLGVYPDVIDDEQPEEMVPCWRCRKFCAACGQWVKKEGHRCVMDRMDLWLHFFRSALASVGGADRTPVRAAEHAAEIADEALEAYGKRERGEISVKGLEKAKEKSKR